jgi:hypothetical protein
MLWHMNVWCRPCGCAANGVKVHYNDVAVGEHFAGLLAENMLVAELNALKA